MYCIFYRGAASICGVVSCLLFLLHRCSCWAWLSGTFSYAATISPGSFDLQFGFLCFQYGMFVLTWQISWLFGTCRGSVFSACFLSWSAMFKGKLLAIRVMVLSILDVDISRSVFGLRLHVFSWSVMFIVILFFLVNQNAKSFCLLWLANWWLWLGVAVTANSAWFVMGYLRSKTDDGMLKLWHLLCSILSYSYC